MSSRGSHQLAAIALAALSTLGACSADPPASSSASTSPLATAPAGPVAGSAVVAVSGSGTVDAAAFKAMVDTPGVALLDVRTPEEFAAGHLAGAVNIDAEAPDFEAKVSALNKTQPYAIYCRSGRRSAIAMAKMLALGFSSVHDLGGGISAWEQSGFPIET